MEGKKNMKKLITTSFLILIVYLNAGCVSLVIHTTIISGPTPVFPGTTTDLSVTKAYFAEILHKDPDHSILESTLLTPIVIIDFPFSFIVDTLFLPKDIYYWSHWVENKKRNDAKKAQYAKEEIRKSKEIENASVQIMKEISKDWAPGVLRKNFSPAIIKKIGKDNIKQIAALYKTLGKYKKHSTFSIIKNHYRPLVTVSMQCDFEKGKGLVKLVMTQQYPGLMLENINITRIKKMKLLLKKGNQ